MVKNMRPRSCFVTFLVYFQPTLVVFIYLFVHLLIMCFQLKRYFFTLSSTLKSIVMVFVYKVHFSILVIWGCLDSGHK